MLQRAPHRSRVPHARRDVHWSLALHMSPVALVNTGVAREAASEEHTAMRKPEVPQSEVGRVLGRQAPSPPLPPKSGV